MNALVLLNHPAALPVLGGLLGTLSTASLARAGYGRTRHAHSHPTFYRNLTQRIRAWWAMVAVFALSCLVGTAGPVVLFAGVSFLALRELVSQMSTERADHGSLLWIFYAVLPAQYLLIGLGQLQWFAIFAPVAGLAIIVVRNLIAGDAENFLSRTSQTYLAAMLTIYAIGYVPAIAQLGTSLVAGIGLLLFFTICAQASDVLQYLSGNLFGKRALSPHISPNKTLEGAIGGILATGLLAAALHGLTPVSIGVAALLGMAISLLGICGDLFLSAIKRDLGVKDFSTSIPGHGGVLDRVDSLVFAAPVFFWPMTGLL